MSSKSHAPREEAADEQLEDDRDKASVPETGYDSGANPTWDPDDEQATLYESCIFSLETGHMHLAAALKQGLPGTLSAEAETHYRIVKKVRWFLLKNECDDALKHAEQSNIESLSTVLRRDILQVRLGINFADDTWQDEWASDYQVLAKNILCSIAMLVSSPDWDPTVFKQNLLRMVELGHREQLCNHKKRQHSLVPYSSTELIAAFELLDQTTKGINTIRLADISNKYNLGGKISTFMKKIIPLLEALGWRVQRSASTAQATASLTRDP